MIRRVIEIDDKKCSGCGICVKACHEGAIGLVYLANKCSLCIKDVGGHILLVIFCIIYSEIDSTIPVCKDSCNIPIKQLFVEST